MEHFIAVEMPEPNEGKESNVVCLVKGANLKDVGNCIFGKGYGVWGHDYGVDAYEFNAVSLKDLPAWVIHYDVPVLDFKDFKACLAEGQLTWYKVIEWQRWGSGYVDTERKLVVVNERARADISNCFEKYCGYGVEVTIDNRDFMDNWYKGRDKGEVVKKKKSKRREKRKKPSEIRNLLKEALGICKTILRNPSKARKEARKYLRCIFRKAQEDD